MIKKLYQKDGFILIDNNKEHVVLEKWIKTFLSLKNFRKKGDIKKEDAIKEYYKSMGFNYTL